jgi:DNA-directed RNA polymerase specialized sigma24 family protein
MSPARFDTTQWSLVLAAKGQGEESERALATLCEVYWPPLYAFIRKQQYSPEEARDLTQGYFTRLLEKRYLSQVDRERGRFRSFLLVTCRHFLSNERDHQRAGKRGGGSPALPIDGMTAETRYAMEPSHDETPERVFLRRWALTLLDHVLAAIEADYAAAGKGALFAALKPFLIGDGPADPAEPVAASQLGLTDGALRVAVHRLRRRFRERLRAEVARTLEDPQRVDEEISSLLAAL